MVDSSTEKNNIVYILKSVGKTLLYVSGNIWQTDVILQLDVYCSFIEIIVSEVYKLRLHTAIACLETVLT